MKSGVETASSKVVIETSMKNAERESGQSPAVFNLSTNIGKLVVQASPKSLESLLKQPVFSSVSANETSEEILIRPVKKPHSR